MPHRRDAREKISHAPTKIIKFLGAHREPVPSCSQYHGSQLGKTRSFCELQCLNPGNWSVFKPRVYPWHGDNPGFVVKILYFGQSPASHSNESNNPHLAGAKPCFSSANPSYVCTRSHWTNVFLISISAVFCFLSFNFFPSHAFHLIADDQK